MRAHERLTDRLLASTLPAIAMNDDPQRSCISAQETL
jgi:hypothetical protein